MTCKLRDHFDATGQVRPAQVAALTDHDSTFVPHGSKRTASAAALSQKGQPRLKRGSGIHNLMSQGSSSTLSPESKQARPGVGSNSSVSPSSHRELRQDGSNTPMSMLEKSVAEALGSQAPSDPESETTPSLQ